VLQAACATTPSSDNLPDYARWADPRLTSLDDLSVEALRERRYGSVISPVATLTSETGTALVAEYPSDGLRLYTRIDIPDGAAPPAGFPAVIFVHGWYGREKAPAFDFLAGNDSDYAAMIRRYVDAGFVVFSPGLRGHGTVNGRPAEGIEFLDRWDNGSYLGPMWYTIDILNLLDGIESLESADWSGQPLEAPLRIDRGRISITGHSQGGDAVLTALAVSGEGSNVRNPLMAGSILAGCFAPRMQQVEMYGPMADTLEAFMSGDGSWTGHAAGADGTVNPEFVFGFPPDWIETVDPASPDWSWQAEAWSVPTVAESLQRKYDEMYRAVNGGVSDIDDARFELLRNESGRTVAKHDPRVANAMRRIGGFHYESLLGEPLHLHHSDQDYYSVPSWNADLAARVNAAGGKAVDFNYPQNTHSLRASKHDWFSDGEVVAGIEYALDRDLRLFSTGQTAPPRLPDEVRVSPRGLARYAASVQNELRTEFLRDPLHDHQRRVVRFSADGLNQFALVVEPAGPPPDTGWPVVLMNHGHHPNPPDNGKRADGTTDRPGDYYRGIPLAFAQAGFLVVWPDYRGHNVSEGFEYTQTEDPHGWYARDVIALFRALGSLPGADTTRVFLWGHSIGADVTLRAAAALNGEILGTSLWSTMLRETEDKEGGFYVPDAGAIPVLIQHDIGDPTVPIDHSEAVARQRPSAVTPTRLLRLPGEEHLFSGDALHQAIERDVAFFNELLAK
jgi:dienelactone hydrolase